MADGFGYVQMEISDAKAERSEGCSPDPTCGKQLLIGYMVAHA